MSAKWLKTRETRVCLANGCTAFTHQFLWRAGEWLSKTQLFRFLAPFPAIYFYDYINSAHQDLALQEECQS